MARVVYICFRYSINDLDRVALDQTLTIIDERIRGDGMESRMLKVESHDEIFATCINYTDIVRIDGSSIGVGYVCDESIDWSIPGMDRPEGTYAIFRGSKNSVELLSDAMATRTIWYYHDESIFIASTSQRALVMLLGSFSPNSSVIPWMLMNGVMGPIGAWDKRLQSVPPSCRVVLDRKSWIVNYFKEQVSFSPGTQSDEFYRVKFRQAIELSIRDLLLESKRWILPLSGGYDSRLLACLLNDRKDLLTVTWGMPPNAEDRGSEGGIAALLARKLGFKHRYFPIEMSEESIGIVMDRFVRMSEGRTDNLLSLIDGFKLCQRLSSHGIQGIIRGDEAFGGFGWSPVYNSKDVRMGLGLAMASDLSSTAWLLDLAGMTQSLPESLAQKDGECLEAWRYRLYHDYRVPVALAALTETESAYFDAVKPLQFHSVVQVIRELPEHLRIDKYLLIDFVNDLCPKVPYGSVREGEQLISVLRQKRTIAFLTEELQSEYARTILPSSLIRGILNRLSSDTSRQASNYQLLNLRLFDAWIRENMPRFMKRYFKKFAPPSQLDSSLLAFRAWIVVRVHRLMEEDATAANNRGGTSSE